MIYFFKEATELNLPHGVKSTLKEIIKFLAKEENKKIGKLNYIFTSDSYLLEINQKYLHHDDLTDIITFDSSDKKGTLSGDIFISLERVKENAQKWNQTYFDEILRVAIHGALHLCGYGDKSLKDKKNMRLLEDKYLQTK